MLIVVKEFDLQITRAYVLALVLVLVQTGEVLQNWIHAGLFTQVSN